MPAELLERRETAEENFPTRVIRVRSVDQLLLRDDDLFGYLFDLREHETIRRGPRVAVPHVAANETRVRECSSGVGRPRIRLYEPPFTDRFRRCAGNARSMIESHRVQRRIELAIIPGVLL